MFQTSKKETHTRFCKQRFSQHWTRNVIVQKYPLKIMAESLFSGSTPVYTCNFAAISSATFFFWCMWTNRWVTNDLSLCTFIWTFMTRSHSFTCIRRRRKSQVLTGLHTFSENTEAGYFRQRDVPRAKSPLQMTAPVLFFKTSRPFWCHFRQARTAGNTNN